MLEKLQPEGDKYFADFLGWLVGSPKFSDLRMLLISYWQESDRT